MTVERQPAAVPMPFAAFELALCVTSVFLSAFLLFILEPMIARLHLTRYGGSAAVWNTALVFFQAALLLGYLYADRVPAWIGARKHLALHAVLLALPLFFLPPGLRWEAPAGDSPVTAILVSLAVNIGLPFFVLATNATLVQVWHARSTGSRDPFWLYAASNLGSILALLLYPLLIEPRLGIAAQAGWWQYGYVIFLLVSLGLMASAARAPRAAPRDPTVVTTPRITRLGWIVRAAIASSLLMSITMALTEALGSTPLLWTIPLLVYLLTFVLAFGNASPPRRLLAWGCILGAAASLASLFFFMPLRVIVPAYLVTLFCGAMLCHRDIYERRPAAGELSGFYLAIALGGFFGGVFNAILAPLVFDRISEFPITLAALAFAVDAGRPWRESFPRERLRQPGVFLPPATMFVMIVAAYVVASAPAARTVLLLGVLLFGVLLGRHPGQFAVAASLVALFLAGGPTWGANTIREERSFFGVSTVLKEGQTRIYRHSGIVHGEEMDPPRNAIATAYFHRDSPIAEIFARTPARARIGTMGLGVGMVAVYTKPGQTLDFFEIDPVVARVAREEFSFLENAHGTVNVEIGDGRLLAAGVPDRSFDLLFVDAFSGGSMPLHLITAEALAMYLEKCSNEGIVLLHISSRAVAFDRVLRGWSRASGVPVMFKGFRPDAAQVRDGAKASDVVAITLSPRVREELTVGGWRTLGLAGPSVRWTDDHASALPVLSFGR